MHVDNTKNKLIVASLGEMSKPGAGIKVVDLKSKTITTLGKEGTTSPFGGLDGIESDTTDHVTMLLTILQERYTLLTLMEQDMEL